MRLVATSLLLATLSACASSSSDHATLDDLETAHDVDLRATVEELETPAAPRFRAYVDPRLPGRALVRAPRESGLRSLPWREALERLALAVHADLEDRGGEPPLLTLAPRAHRGLDVPAALLLPLLQHAAHDTDRHWAFTRLFLEPQPPGARPALLVVRGRLLQVDEEGLGIDAPDVGFVVAALPPPARDERASLLLDLQGLPAQAEVEVRCAWLDDHLEARRLARVAR